MYMQIRPVISASAHPIGMASQIPVSPIKVERTYARSTRVPREMTVRMTDISARLIAR